MLRWGGQSAVNIKKIDVNEPGYSYEADNGNCLRENYLIGIQAFPKRREEKNCSC